MKGWSYAFTSWRLLLLLPSIFLSSTPHASLALAASGEAKVSKTSFDSRPSALFYFDDTDVILFHDRPRQLIWRSTDAGASWKTVDGLPEDIALYMWQHPFDNNKAYLLSGGTNHFYSNDRGETWQEFETEGVQSTFREPLSFHAADSDRVIFNGMFCWDPFNCPEAAFVTTDGFKTKPVRMRDHTRGCRFAKSAEPFTTGRASLDEKRIFCVTVGRQSSWPKHYRLVVSDDYFATEEEPLLDGDRTVAGVINTASVKGFLVVATRSEGTDELALYVTADAATWHRAEFPGDNKVEEDAYTILESTNYSIQVDVKTTRFSQPMGVLFSSNSNGTYFTELIKHTNRNDQGFVGFEQIQGIRGISMVNVVDNWEEVQGSRDAEKRIRSQITFNDGRTFHDIRADKKALHLRSVTDLHNTGRIFSSPAPGIVMGVGNTGDALLSYDEGDLYVSDDAGLNFRKGLEGAHKFEFGDSGSIIAAVYDEEATSVLKYSLNHGKDWDEVDLGETVSARLLTTAPDSTTLKFLLVGSSGVGSNTKYFIFNIDFSTLHERTCGDDDFEKWYARLDEKGNPDCLMGQKQYYMRRKPDADCFVKKKFVDPIVETETCPCTDEDYECDFNFVRDDKGDCQPAPGASIVPDGECKSEKDTFRGSSGYRKIPGNTCTHKNGFDPDEEKDWPCEALRKKPTSGKITATLTTFDASKFRDYFYLERTTSSKGDDETVIMHTDAQEFFRSEDHGATWQQILEDEDVVMAYPHQYINDQVYFVTASKKVFYSMDRGKSLHHFEAPEVPNTLGLPILDYHPNHGSWLIWTGQEDCSSRGSGAECHAVAYYSTNGGHKWDFLRDYVKKCQFITEKGRGHSEKLVYCEQFQNENKNNPLQLVSSDDFFVEHTEVPFNDIIDFATMSEFIIVAAKDTAQQSLKIDASIDGTTFADAKFPPLFQVPHQQAYTVLDSSTHAVFLHVTVNTLMDHEFGSLMKSNSNGTSYVQSIAAVNRNPEGYVDFEKMQGLEGVAVVNVVDNHEEAAKGQLKRLKTMITHNDGAEWAYIPKPKLDADGKEYKCDEDVNKCSLHLHGYTERDDPRDTYSSASAVGLMMAVGNVGEYLGRYGEGDTFITRDGGVTWSSAKKGTFLWEYGDQGSIITIVERDTPTKIVYYTLDEGVSWEEYQFSDDEMRITDITTVPSDNSRKFLLWGRQLGGRAGNKIATISLNFEGLRDRKCDLDENEPEKGDYILWTPKHPLQQDDCLFGHVTQYHRKKPEAACYNGPLIEKFHAIVRNCTCERQDFECDYNFERKTDGSCGMVKDEKPLDAEQVCKDNPDMTEYYEVTGYRKPKLDTCVGGRELDKGIVHYCPGHEEEFKEKHGIGGFALFCAIVLPIGAAAGVGYWVWRNWDGKFGRIRLGETTAGAGWEGAVGILATVVAGVWVVVSMVPDVVGRLYTWATGGSRRYTSRSSFQRARGEYAAVTRAEQEDVGGLLGDESDEDV